MRAASTQAARRVGPRSSSRALSTTLGCCLALAAAAGAQQRYTVTTIPPLSGHMGSMALDLNDSGQVVGSSEDILGYHWSAGVLVALPPLHGGTWSHACGINALGDAVGSAGSNDYILHGVKWAPESRGGFVPTNLGVGIGDVFAVARAINDRGDIVGCSDNGYAFKAVTWNYDSVYGAYRLTELPRPLEDPWSDAFAVNAAGTTIVGESNNPMFCRAIRWDRSGESWSVTVLPGWAGTLTSSAADINDPGVIVGWVLTSDRTEHLAIWDSGAVSDLGTLQGKRTFGQGINDAGDVVGSTMSWIGVDSAFVRLAGSETADLNAMLPPESPWHLQSAEAINNTGQITGYGRLRGFTQSFLLTPISMWLAMQSPDASGEQRLVVAGATPGAMVSFFAASAGGETVIPGCSMTLDLGNPTLFGATQADAAGRAELAVPVVDSLADRGILLQAFEFTTCRVSSVARYAAAGASEPGSEVYSGSRRDR